MTTTISRTKTLWKKFVYKTYIETVDIAIQTQPYKLSEKGI